MSTVAIRAAQLPPPIPVTVRRVRQPKKNLPQTKIERDHVLNTIRDYVATHKVVPTWNYAVVHAHGVLQTVEHAPWLHQLVSRLTAHQEAPRETPWAVGDAPEDFVQQMLRAIVGIQIPVDRLVGKWKVSQNRSEADRTGVADGLASTSSAMAALVRGR